MAQLKSMNRGTRRFQISGVDEALYRCYQLVAGNEDRSLNSQLLRAVYEYMHDYYPETLEGCKQGLPDEKIEFEASLRPAEMQAKVLSAVDAAITRMKGASPSKPPQAPKAQQPQQPQAETMHIRTERGTLPPPVNKLPTQPVEYKRHPWPGPGPAGTAIGDEWAAAGKPDYPEWDAMQAAKKEAAAYPPLPPTAEPPGVVPKVLLPPTSDPKYDAKVTELYNQEAREHEERLKRRWPHKI